MKIIEEAGLEYDYYFYWDKKEKKINIDKWIETIKVLIHKSKKYLVLFSLFIIVY